LGFTLSSQISDLTQAVLRFCGLFGRPYVLREVSAHTLFVRLHGLRLAPKLEITKRSKTFAQMPLNKTEKSNRVLEDLGSVAGTGAVEMAAAPTHRRLHAPPPCAASTRRRCAPREEAEGGRSTGSRRRQRRSMEDGGRAPRAVGRRRAQPPARGRCRASPPPRAAAVRCLHTPPLCAARGDRGRAEHGLHAPPEEVDGGRRTGSTRRRAPPCAAACLREMSCGAHLREKGGRDEAALVAAMLLQRRHGPREGGNDVRGEGLGGCVGCYYSGLRD
jgi:hypothetical protein